METRTWLPAFIIGLLLGCFLLQQASTQDDEPTYKPINMCFLIDKVTNAFILSMGYESVNQYFDSLVYVCNLLMLDLDPNLTFKRYAVQVLPMVLQLYNVNGRDFSANSLKKADGALWDKSGLWKRYQKAGCHMGFYASPNDYLFKASQMDGIANMLQACAEYSHGIIRLFKSGGRSAIVASHEMGHVLGIYHDGNMQDKYVKLHSIFPDEVSALWYACEMSTTSQCNDTVGSCIMNGVYITSLGLPTHVSNCSRIYYKMYLTMAHAWPMYYDTTCFLEYPED